LCYTFVIWVAGKGSKLLEENTMTKEFNVIIERDSEDYYVATVPELRGCHTQAKSLDTLMKRVREAIQLCLEVEGGAVEPNEFIDIQRGQIDPGSSSLASLANK
jgi:predicted RNase H-like HicB family nuclease